MKIAILISLVAIASGYSDITDPYNNDVYTRNNTVLHQYLDCFLDKGPCNSVANSVKPHLPEIIKDACHECDDVQRHHARQFFKAAMKFLPQGYQELRSKYDTDGKHFDVFEKAISNY